jgi:hypothetical protein
MSGASEAVPASGSPARALASLQLDSVTSVIAPELAGRV